MAACQRYVEAIGPFYEQSVPRSRVLADCMEQILACGMFHCAGELATAASQTAIHAYEDFFHSPNPFLLSRIASMSFSTALSGSVSTMK